MLNGLSDELTHRVAELAGDYFGEVSIKRSVEVINSQAASMDYNSKTVCHEQAGDLLFALVAMAQNQNWSLDRLLSDAIVKVENRKNARHYYEAHITVEPVFDEGLERFKLICKDYKFRVANLLMQRRPTDTEERSKNDSFCTGRGISYTDIRVRMLELVKRLEQEGFKIWRYKIEATLMDSRYDDKEHILDKETLPEKERNPKPPADGALTGRI